MARGQEDAASPDARLPPVADSLIGAIGGGELGAYLRGRYFARKERRIDVNRPVRIRCRAHPTGRPQYLLDMREPIPELA